LLNTAGGILLIGRDDHGNILGVDNVFDAEERLANAIADGIHPSLLPEIETVSIEGKALLLVRVVHWQGPFYLKSKGMSEGVYVRLGSTNRVAGPELLEELQRSLSKISFDQLPCPDTDITGLDMQKIEQLFSEVGQRVNKSSLETLGVLVRHAGNLVCSNGGIILFGQDHLRERYFPNSTVRCARFRGTDKVDFIDQYDVSGTIIDAMTEVPKFIGRNTRLAAKIKKIHRHDIPEYSPFAFREVLTNALVHADYSIKGMNIRVAIFSDRLEIESPGMLPFGFTLEDFFAGVSHVRNKVIARVFRELCLMEEWGTGYRRITQVCEEAGYSIPTWRELGTVVRVAFNPHSATEEKIQPSEPTETSELTSRQQTIMTLFEKEKELTAKEVIERLDVAVSERTSRLDLFELKKRGLLMTTGKGPSTRWSYLQNLRSSCFYP